MEALGCKQCADTVECAYSKMSVFLTSPPASIDAETVWKSIIHLLIFPTCAEVSSDGEYAPQWLFNLDLCLWLCRTRYVVFLDLPQFIFRL